MITNSNKTIRFEDSDLVTTSIFNQALSSLDRTLLTIKNVVITTNNQMIANFTSSLTDNIALFINLKTLEDCIVDIRINYQDSFGAQQYVLLNNYNLKNPDTYSFNPFYISINQGTPITIIVNSNKLNSKVFISASAIAA